MQFRVLTGFQIQLIFVRLAACDFAFDGFAWFQQLGRSRRQIDRLSAHRCAGDEWNPQKTRE
jgi:hypothetical protein